MRKAGLKYQAIAFMQFAGKIGLFDECRVNRTAVRLQLETEYRQGLFMLISIFCFSLFFLSFSRFL